MNAFVDILFQITLVLKIPVVVCLLALFAVILFETGMFLREGVNRNLGAKPFKQYMAGIFGKVKEVSGLEKGSRVPGFFPPMVSQFVKIARHHPENRAYLEKVFTDVEMEAQRRCRLVKLGVRLGPVLGLMGTLIPMGPALMSISTGDLENMARNLVMAFSTTVVGLLTGSLCLIILVVRQHWYASDMAAIDSLYQAVFSREIETK